jgi:hypothetical protein
LHPHRSLRHHPPIHDTATDIATALAKARPFIAAQRKLKVDKKRETSMTVLMQDKRIAKTLLDKLFSQAETRLLGIIAHRQQKIIREQAVT